MWWSSSQEKRVTPQCKCFQVAGFQSYDDGCVAEMRMPDQADDFADIRLLLCLGHIPPSLGRIDQSTRASKHSPEGLDSGTVGTLLRTAAALQWQGAWILPSCPDVFNPLAIRASQVRQQHPEYGDSNVWHLTDMFEPFKVLVTIFALIYSCTLCVGSSLLATVSSRQCRGTG